MSKFHKTVYPRNQPLNCFMQSALSRRVAKGTFASMGANKNINGEISVQLPKGEGAKGIFNKHSKQIPLNQIHRRIEPQCLFNVKLQKKPLRYEQLLVRKEINRSEAKTYESRAFEVAEQMSLQKERPQSKQEARNRVEGTQRPQTSKGRRVGKNLNCTKESDIFSAQQFININKVRALTSQTKRLDQSFETSLDPQFLGLFAS